MWEVLARASNRTSLRRRTIAHGPTVIGALRKEGEVLRTTRGERARLDLGYYYVHEPRRNLALQPQVDLETLGRELGVLGHHESVQPED